MESNYRYSKIKQQLQVDNNSNSSQTSSNRVRIVHISDTHLLHADLQHSGCIPDGDILIHTGDFSSYQHHRRLTPSDLEEQVNSMDEFFRSLPHKYKIFVAGNHETNFQSVNPYELQRAFEHVIYLQDSWVTIEGMKVYGSPWNINRWYSFATSYTKMRSDMSDVWSAIPDGVDILATHSPPLGILDLETIVSGYRTLWRGRFFCHVCRVEHGGDQEHFGCARLRDVVFDKRPLAHLFGHSHYSHGLLQRDGIVFSNAAMKLGGIANVIDIFRSETSHVTNTIPVYCRSSGNMCEIM